ncbi:MAG: GNAT family N-acetyltransferase [Caldilineaceae bacterium]
MLDKKAITIRRAQPADAATLTKIAIAAKSYWNYPDELMALWRASLTFTPAGIAQHQVYVATVAEEIIGFYAVAPTADAQRYELDDLWIEPAYIGQGVGRLLFQHAVALVQAEGGTMLQLVAEPHALGFYAKMGMRKIGERPSQPPGRVLDLMAIDLK